MEQLRMKKTLMISTGVVSLALTLKLSLPVTLDILVAEVPRYWSSFTALSWLQPPYLYLIVNCIIISIVASSKLNSSGGAVLAEEFVAVVDAAVKEEAEVGEEAEVVKEVVFGYVERKDAVDESVCGGGDVVQETEKTMLMSPEVVMAPLEAVEVVEKPPFSARFGHRKSLKGSPQGKTALKKVSRPKRQETLESTWRTLTEGRSMPLTRHLRKSDTFTGATLAASPPVRVMQKSETFSGGDVESPSPGSGKLRREPSLSQDDLNRRVEAFIKKFNEEMRLQQQQESLNHYRRSEPNFSYETVSQ